MKRKISYYSFALLFWISVSSTNALADFTLTDSDGDIYYVGPFLGKTLNNESFPIQYTKNDSFSSTGEGFLYYDDFYGSVKILIFENEETVGFTLEGIWEGDGSTMYYIDNRGERTDVGLSLSRFRDKRSKTTRSKNNIKK
jgi:hypothetical protein